jgi:hypothetical protein
VRHRQGCCATGWIRGWRDRQADQSGRRGIVPSGMHDGVLLFLLLIAIYGATPRTALLPCLA